MVLAYEMQTHKERVSKRSETCPLLVLMQEFSTGVVVKKGTILIGELSGRWRVPLLFCANKKKKKKKKPKEQSGNSWEQFGLDPSRSSVVFLEWPFGSWSVEFIGFIKLHNNSEAAFVFCLSSSLFCCTKTYIMILKFQ